MLDQYQSGPENLYASKEITRAVSRVAELVPIGSQVTIEATPLYAGQIWDESHEFGFNGFLPLQIAALRIHGCSPIHIAMIDDFTTGEVPDTGYFVRQMRQRPERVHFESEFNIAAESYIQQLRNMHRVSGYNGELHLSGGSQPRLTVRSGRASCELLDACYQKEKGEGTHIIIHPTKFVSQQQGMREILCAMNGDKLPGNFINIFFKRNVLSRILFTDYYGRTRNI